MKKDLKDLYEFYCLIVHTFKLFPYQSITLIFIYLLIVLPTILLATSGHPLLAFIWFTWQTLFTLYFVKKHLNES